MKLLIAYDGSDHARGAIDDLVRAGLPRETEALVISVADAFVPPPEVASSQLVDALTSPRVAAVVAQAQAQAEQALKEAQGLADEGRERVLSHFPYWQVSAEAEAGTPAWVIIQKADAWKPDLIVVGSRGRSMLGRLLLGSVSQKIVTEARCSVLVARPTGRRGDAPVRIIIGVDGSPDAERAVREVGARIWRDGTEVRVIAADTATAPTRIAHILPTAAAMVNEGNEEAMAKPQEMLDWAAEELRAIGLNVTAEVIKGDPQRTLIDEARKWEADCIFVGSRGLSGALERLRLGSVSTALVTNAHCSVEVVRVNETT